MPLELENEDACIAACRTTTGCELVVYSVTGLCYLKRQQGNDGHTGESSWIQLACPRGKGAGLRAGGGGVCVGHAQVGACGALAYACCST